MAIDEKIIDEAKAKHGTVLHLVHADEDGGVLAEVLVKKPSRAAYKRFRAMSFDEKQRADAMETLMRDAVVYPAQAEWDAMLDVYPALCETFAKDVLALLGAGAKADAKKY